MKKTSPGTRVDRWSWLSRESRPRYDQARSEHATGSDFQPTCGNTVWSSSWDVGREAEGALWKPHRTCRLKSCLKNMSGTNDSGGIRGRAESTLFPTRRWLSAHRCAHQSYCRLILQFFAQLYL